MRAELIDTRNEIRHARDREAAAVARAEAGVSSRPASAPEAPVRARQRLWDGRSRRRRRHADWRRPADRRIAADARRRLSEAADASREFAEHLESLLAVDEPTTSSVGRSPVRRSAIALPGGVISTSAVAAQHLVTAGAPIFVDGYNVAKLAWPDKRARASTHGTDRPRREPRPAPRRRHHHRVRRQFRRRCPRPTSATCARRLLARRGDGGRRDPGRGGACSRRLPGRGGDERS